METPRRSIGLVKKHLQQDLIEVGDWVVIDKDQKGRTEGCETVIKAGSVGRVSNVGNSLNYVRFLFGYHWVNAHAKATINEYKQILDLLQAPETAFNLKSENFLLAFSLCRAQFCWRSHNFQNSC